MLSFIQMLIVGLYVMTSLVGLKVIPFGPFHVAAGVIFIAAVKPLLDIVNEVWGARVARFTVTSMSIIRAIVFAMMGLVAMLPAFKQPEGMQMLLLGSFGLFAGGLAAEWIASVLLDIPFFEAMKKSTKLPFVVRQILSNISVVVQTFIFTIVYTQIQPGVPFMKMFLGQTVALIVISSVLAPAAALAVKKIKH